MANITLIHMFRGVRNTESGALRTEARLRRKKGDRIAMAPSHTLIPGQVLLFCAGAEVLNTALQ